MCSFHWYFLGWRVMRLCLLCLYVLRPARILGLSKINSNSAVTCGCGLSLPTSYTADVVDLESSQGKSTMLGAALRCFLNGRGDGSSRSPSASDFELTPDLGVRACSSSSSFLGVWTTGGDDTGFTPVRSVEALGFRRAWLSPDGVTVSQWYGGHWWNVALLSPALRLLWGWCVRGGPVLRDLSHLSGSTIPLVCK